MNQQIAKKINNSLAQDIFQIIKDGGRHPSLAIVLAGNREDSRLYVSLKEKTARSVGIDTSLYLVNDNDSEKDLIDLINFLNQDLNIDGILIQLPLPSRYNTDKILQTIDKNKDVDGFSRDKNKVFSSPVLMAVEASFKYLKLNLKEKKACLFFNSAIFKNEIEKFLKARGVEVLGVPSSSFDKYSENDKAWLKLKEKIRNNDILITAMGRPEIINKDFLKNQMVVIDIGISKVDGRVLGDVNFSDSRQYDVSISPVPGGIGPITVACLLKNVLQAYNLKNKNKDE